MKVCLVPMKPLERAKERLADVLSPADRRSLSLAMLRDVCRAGAAVDGPVWVLCSDPDAADAAREAGAEPRLDDAWRAGLNDSLAAATAEAVADGATAVLVLSADLPSASADDVRAMVLGDGIAVAPDRYGRGTNALWRKPADVIPTFYGTASRRAHEGLAFARSIPCAIVARPGLAFDLDDPRDLATATTLPLGAATREALGALGYPRGRR